ncbi:MAG: cell surface protein SprA [Flavobacteriaceae bacterium]
MKLTPNSFITIFTVVVFLTMSDLGWSQVIAPAIDSVATDSIPKLPYQIGPGGKASLYLAPSVTKEVIYDPQLKKYIIVEKIGDFYVKPPIYMSPKEYEAYSLERDMLDYYQSKLNAIDGGSPSDEARRNLLPTYYVDNDFFESIFGGNEIEVNLQGSVNVKLGVIYQRIEDPKLSERNRGNINFDFDQQISASVVAKIGKRLNVSMNYDTNATFDFQNLVKIAYTPTEDDILRALEVGNVSMPVQNSLIPGAQSLFGAKADLQFGRTTITGVVSQQNSETQRISTESGGALNEFELKTTDYDVNRHFFLAQYFRNNFNTALANYPLINSGIQISKVEIWITNKQSQTENVRNLVGLVDIGESGTSKEGGNNITNPNVIQENPGPNNEPDNQANNLNTLLDPNGSIRTISGVPGALAPYGMDQGKDYSVIENARRLEPSEYKLDSQLGYISLNRRLDDGEVLAVAFQYTDQTGAVYQVGEFSSDGISAPDNLVVKLLRSEVLFTADPIWKLMMKNIYALGAFGVTQDGFRLELLYKDDQTGVPINSLQNANTAGVSDRTLMNLLHTDRLDQNSFVQEGGDGIFDFVPGVTINTEKGYLMFPQTDPFGFDLAQVLDDQDDIYVFTELYEQTKVDAANNYQNKDKYLIKGYFKGDSQGGISLGAFNIPRGSVVVTSGGRQLVEGVDYVVDYQMGEVQIINPAIEANGAPIDVALENNNLFNQQTKSFMGLDVQHQFSDDFLVGATILSVNEKPLTQKVGIGSEPINNTVIGFNTAYGSEVPFLTNMVNKLPFVDTEVPSNVSIRADVAILRPGVSKGIELNGEPTSYIDDFEGAQVPIDVGIASQWYTSSTPQGFNFGGDLVNDPRSNYQRARLAWYTIDQLFYGSSSLRPENIDADELSRAEVRRVSTTELFPNQELDATVSNNLRTFDMAYFPQERGAYNYDLNVDAQGDLMNPEERWGGLMRPLTTNDFDQANVSYIQFWIQDPYTQYSITEEEGLPSSVDPSNPGNQVGDLYINLGNVSEDVLKDNRKGFENGLPDNGIDDQVDYTNLARVSTKQALLYTFDEDDATRLNQDVGFDGLDDENEKLNFGDNAILGSDPSSDNYQFYRGSDLDAMGATLIDRYRYYNNTEGNSPTLSMSPESYSTAATNFPDIEDINKDNTMNSVEAYFQYKVSMKSSDLQVGKNFVVDEKEVPVTLPNGETKTFRWLQFRIPVRDPSSKVGSINDFHSIRFMRMFMTGFKMPVVLRFAKLELVRGDWRRYLKTIDQDPPVDLDPAEQRMFTEGVVNLEENDTRVPIPYVMPPGIQRESLQGSVYVLQQNEQSVSLKVEDLPAGETRALYKNMSLDMRMYKKLDLFIHAEGVQGRPLVEDDELIAVVRIGSDLTENYYQIEQPLKITSFNAVTADEIWPEENNLDAVLAQLAQLKLERYQAFDGDSNELYPAVIPGEEPEFRIRVKGNPNLGNIQAVMMGVQNNSNMPVNAELWFDELRLSGFENDGGWAGVLSADANLADFADLSLTAGIETTGFGGVEESLQERSLEDVKQYDFVTNINLGMLTPKKWGLQIPFNYGMSEEFRDPKYDQQYQDVLYNDAAEINPNSTNSRSYTKRKNLSFINVKKQRNLAPGEDPKFYDIENFMMSYSFSEMSHRDYNIESDIDQNLRSSANYTYTKSPDFISPFKNVEAFQSSYLKFLNEFNFNPLPTTIGVNANVQRNYTEQLSRNLIPDLPPMPTLTQHRFLFNWDYNIGYDLSRSLSVNFKAANHHVNDNLTGVEEVDIFDEFFVVGRPDNYRQTLNATYQLPFDKIPFLDFVGGAYSYTADFDWQASSQSYVDQIGNTIQNANTHSLSTDLNFNKLYKSIGLESLFYPKPKRNTEGPQAKKSISRKPESSGFKDGVYDVLTMVKRAKVSYASNNGSYMQGYIPTVGFLGRTSYNNGYAPSLGFVFGSQQDILQEAVAQNWIVSRGEDDPYYNKAYNQTEYTKLDFNASLKPVKNFDIELFANRIYAKNASQQVDVIDGVYNDAIPLNQIGNFSISYMMIGTSGDSTESLFETFRNNREIISKRLSEESGLPQEGFGLDSQQVMLPAFVAAYSGKSAEDVNMEAIKETPIPNWKVTYRGLMNLKWFKENFSNFTLTHNYQSFYSIANFNANLNYDKSNPAQVDASGNYLNELNYTNLSLIEEFSPLIKVDMRMKNSFSLKGEVHTDRMFTMNFNNETTTEVVGQEYVVGLGYRVKDVAFRTKVNGRSKRLIGDLNLRMDLSMRNNLTLIRSIDSQNNQITGGQTLFSFKFAADYALTRAMQASFYYDHNTSRYALSTTYPRQSINSGISLTYNLGN